MRAKRASVEVWKSGVSRTTRLQKAELLPQLLWKDDEPPPANFTPQLSLYENLIWNSPITSSPNEEADGAELVLKETDLVYSDGSRSCPASHEHLGLQISSSLVTWSHSRRG
ncbi:hypothetical protein Y032_0219g2457 [Ancylostoma ceylanicum]|uniref:Uncharacterized protein n=1 Tax=Ancylostoma ceylanicum TaxID=53326 RepID=A0A016SIM7_9BILA|nr:hypothetical protein Y032_0219g2457 [Ancylostoma ceylanicum]